MLIFLVMRMLLLLNRHKNDYKIGFRSSPVRMFTHSLIRVDTKEWIRQALKACSNVRDSVERSTTNKAKIQQFMQKFSQWNEEPPMNSLTEPSVFSVLQIYCLIKSLTTLICSGTDLPFLCLNETITFIFSLKGLFKMQTD